MTDGDPPPEQRKYHGPTLGGSGRLGGNYGRWENKQRDLETREARQADLRSRVDQLRHAYALQNMDYLTLKDLEYDELRLLQEEPLPAEPLAAPATGIAPATAATGIAALLGSAVDVIVSACTARRDVQLLVQQQEYEEARELEQRRRFEQRQLSARRLERTFPEAKRAGERQSTHEDVSRGG